MTSPKLVMAMACISREQQVPLPTIRFQITIRYSDPTLSGATKCDCPVVSDNTFNVWRTGIYYNYAENNATAWTISGNTINAIAPPANPLGPLDGRV